MAEYWVRLWLVLLKEGKAKTSVRIRRVLLEVGRVPSSTLVSSVKGKEGKDSGSNPLSTGGGCQSTGPVGAVITSSTNGLVCTGFVNRYRLQPRAGF